MRNLFSTKVKIILVVAALLTAALAIYSGISNQSLPSVIVQGVLAPFRAAGTTLTNTAEKYYSYMFRYEALDAENKVLEERIAQMEDVARQADSVSRENERLRKLLELKATNEDYKLVDAYIIGWSSSDWEHLHHQPGHQRGYPGESVRHHRQRRSGGSGNGGGRQLRRRQDRSGLHAGNFRHHLHLRLQRHGQGRLYQRQPGLFPGAVLQAGPRHRLRCAEL